jgi:hypothetical protein
MNLQQNRIIKLYLYRMTISSQVTLVSFLWHRGLVYQLSKTAGRNLLNARNTSTTKKCNITETFEKARIYQNLRTDTHHAGS